MSCPDLASKALDLAAVRSPDHGQHRHASAGRRRRRGARRGTAKALAMTSDCTPRYVQAHPETGGRQAVAEAWRNITATGAKPLAVTDNMNFGNPQKPEIMGQFAGAIMGMAEACKVLDFPVVSRQRLALQRDRGPADPADADDRRGGRDRRRRPRPSARACAQAGLAIVLVGETKGWLGQSLYLREACGGREEGAPPPVDLAVERRNGDFVRGQHRRAPREGLPRPLRRRPARRPGGDVHRRRHRRRRSSCRPERPVPRTRFSMARIKPAISSPPDRATS